MLQYDPYSDRRCACWLLCVVCVALELAGASLLVAASHHRRAQSVSKYDAAVARWTAIRPEFALAAFSLRFNGSSTPLQLDAAKTPEALHDAGADLSKYTPLRYERSLPPPAWREAGVHATIAALGDTRRPGRATKIELGDIEGFPLTMRDTLPASSVRACERAGGSYEGGACVAFLYLAELCIKVRRSADGTVFTAGRPSYSHRTWVADTTGGGVGCAAGAAGVWSPARYERARGAHEPAGAAFHRRPPPRAPAPLVVRVRHADDPLIAAANLTGGALEFPLGDAPKVAGALELLICGALLSVPALVFFCTYGGCGPGWPCHGGSYREGDTRVRLDDLQLHELIPATEAGGAQDR